MTRSMIAPIKDHNSLSIKSTDRPESHVYRHIRAEEKRASLSDVTSKNMTPKLQRAGVDDQGTPWRDDYVPKTRRVGGSFA